MGDVDDDRPPKGLDSKREPSTAVARLREECVVEPRACESCLADNAVLVRPRV
jgi:hypothetical protein